MASPHATQVPKDPSEILFNAASIKRRTVLRWLLRSYKDSFETLMTQRSALSCVDSTSRDLDSCSRRRKDSRASCRCNSSFRPNRSTSSRSINCSSLGNPGHGRFANHRQPQMMLRSQLAPTHPDLERPSPVFPHFGDKRQKIEAKKASDSLPPQKGEPEPQA